MLEGRGGERGEKDGGRNEGGTVLRMKKWRSWDGTEEERMPRKPCQQPLRLLETRRAAFTAWFSRHGPAAGKRA